MSCSLMEPKRTPNREGKGSQPIDWKLAEAAKARVRWKGRGKKILPVQPDPHMRESMPQEQPHARESMPRSPIYAEAWIR